MLVQKSCGFILHRQPHNDNTAFLIEKIYCLFTQYKCSTYFVVCVNLCYISYNVSVLLIIGSPVMLRPSMRKIIPHLCQDIWSYSTIMNLNIIL